MKSKRLHLADAELAVMNLLWNAEQLSSRQIKDVLYPSATATNHGTVQTLLQRLEKKGFIDRDRAASVHLFRAKISREEFGAEELESLADRLADGSLVPFLTHLVEAKRIPDEELRQIRELIERNK